jgi:hypothetical protein
VLVTLDDHVITICLLYSYTIVYTMLLLISEAPHQVLVVAVACKSMAVGLVLYLMPLVASV